MRDNYIDGILYTVATPSWQIKSGFGNHRIIVKAEAGKYIKAVIPWRRRDLHPEKIGFRIRYTSENITSENGIGCGIVENYRILTIDRFRCDLVFEAPESGLYEIYYMPNVMEGVFYSPTTVYLPFENNNADVEWLDGISKADLAYAEVLKYEARTLFDSFYPMELPMTAAECSEFFCDNAPFNVVAESRIRPVRMKYEIPAIWAGRSENELRTLRDEVCKNEHYAFQIAVCARCDVRDVNVEFTLDDGTPVSQDSCVCFNLKGRDVQGHPYDISRNISAGEVLPLWCGVRVEDFKDVSEISFIANVSSAESDYFDSVKVELTVKNEELPNNGDNDLWRMSRLFWLNSDIGINDDLIEPYRPIDYIDDNVFEIMGKTVSLSPLGLPAQIVSRYDESVQYSDDLRTELLSAPIDIVVDDGSGLNEEKAVYQAKNILDPAYVCFDSEVEKNGVVISSHVEYESDGHIDCKLVLTAQKEGDYNFTLTVPVKKDSAQMFMGMSYTGGKVPSQWEYRWDTTYVGNHAWIGNVNVGIQLKLMPENDVWGRTVRVDSVWKNDGKGKMIVYHTDKDVRLEGRTGKVHLASGESRVLHFHMMTTPFHPINTDRHWNEHIYHVDCWGDERVPDLDKAKANGATIINLHQGGILNENINYPFIQATKLKEHVTKAHDMGMRYKLYYTVRELSNYCPELWAFRAMGDEIYAGTSNRISIADYFAEIKVPENINKESGLSLKGGSWLNEHLIEGFSGAWHQFLYDGEFDCAIGTQPISRLHNYYLCGLDWLIREVGVDGLYLDGIGYDRRTMKRVRRVMQGSGKKCDIDIHCGNDHEMTCYGYISPANLYLEHYAYADALWNGEGYHYEDVSPEYYLIESSGIPFGLMGEMLHRGGNPYRGMVYGMTARLGWQQGGMSRVIWDIWEDFCIDEAEMYGWWDHRCPVSVESDSVRATVYKKDDGSVLISVASWYPADQKFLFSVNREQLGIDGDYEFYAPAISGFQEESVFASNELIPIEKNKGWLFYLRRK